MSLGKLIVVSGPSGVGKGTICDSVIKDLGISYSVSTTTRDPREGEVDGINYYFITKDEFENRIIKGDFLEYNLYNNNYYGTSKEVVFSEINQGKDIFLEIDVNGARNIKKIFPEALLIYIAPPSIEKLKERLIKRGTEDMKVINNRLEIAEKELKEISFYDYVVINDNLNKAINEVKDIILKEVKN